MLPFFIAGRYLFAKKSHNVINIISGISAAGMAIGTAALIIILSVYNGFDSLVKSMMGTVEPDLLVTPSSGKVFVPQGEAYDWLYAQESVESICTVLQETVFLDYDGKQSVAVAKGVDEIYEEESPLRNFLRDGEFVLHRGDVPLACVGAGLAYSLGVSPRFLAPIEMYFPSRTAPVSLSNPAASVCMEAVYPSSVFAVNNDIDAECLIVPIEVMRELLEYGDEVSAVEVRMREGTSAREIERVRRTASQMLGDGFKVSTRFQQNESLYKMMKYEKASIYLILIFVIIIIAFNVFGSLMMLIIEKEDDIRTLRSLGATDSLIRRTFVLEGWMISLIGLAAGLAVGIGFVLLQSRFGFIAMPGNFIVRAYPVILSWSDVALTSAAVALIGYLIAFIPVSRRFRRA
ncbi:MAG: FtsX-like permease family protein [Candidatus Cryptobacteroides sp.]